MAVEVRGEEPACGSPHRARVFIPLEHQHGVDSPTGFLSATRTRSVLEEGAPPVPASCRSHLPFRETASRQGTPFDSRGWQYEEQLGGGGAIVDELRSLGLIAAYTVEVRVPHP